MSAWGKRNAGELGDGGPLSEHVEDEPITDDQLRRLPGEVTGLANVKQVAAGQEHSLALLNDGSVRAWGWDEAGQLGDDDELASQSSPVQVEGLLDVVAIAAGRGTRWRCSGTAVCGRGARTRRAS